MNDLVQLFRQSLAGLRVLILLTLVLGLAYPLAVTGIAQVAMPWQANGSLVDRQGAHVLSTSDAVASIRLGQLVDDPALFQPRPSAAGDGYDASASSGSNLGPENPDLIAAIKERRVEVAKRESVAADEVPADAVTASSSGLDPEISPAYAALQVPRVAVATGLSEARVRGLVTEATSYRTLRVMGDPRVNVVRLNIAVAAEGR